MKDHIASPNEVERKTTSLFQILLAFFRKVMKDVPKAAKDKTVGIVKGFIIP